MNPVSRLRQRIAARYARADKTALTNLTFVAAIALSALLLLGAGGYGWWSATLAPGVEVNGHGISKSEAKARGDIAAFEISIQESRIRARIASGTLTPEEGTAALQKISDSQANLGKQATNDMIESLAVSALAQDRGVTVDNTAIDGEWARIVSTPELRLMRRITISIGVGGISTETPTDVEVATAKQKADSIASELAAGGDFGAIAQRDSTDSYAQTGGLIGWSAQEEDPAGDAGYDAAWALTSPGTTAVIRRSADQFVIFAVDEIRPAALDPSFEQRTSEAKLDMGVYKKIAAERALRKVLKSSVLGELLTSPVEQRLVSYVSVADNGAKNEQDEIEASHILFSPNDDARGASKLDPSDPAWDVAEKEATNALSKLQSGTSFASLALASDDKSSSATGGLLTWAPKGSYTAAFEAAIWADGLTKGDLLGPIRTEFGWHVIRFEARRPSLKFRLDLLSSKLKAPGVNFESMAKEAIASTESDSQIEGLSFASAGWISRYSIDPDLSTRVWKLEPGGVSGVEAAQSNFVIIKVEEAKELPLTEKQSTSIRANGFQSWVNEYLLSAEVKVNGTKVDPAAASPQP